MKRAVVLCLAAALAGCGGSAESDAVSAAELRWLQRYSTWLTSLGEATIAANRVYRASLAGRVRIQALEAAFAPFLTCSESLTGRVGAPPTERLRPAATLVERACARFERGARRDLRMRRGVSVRGRSLDAQADWTKGNELFLRAAERLDRLVGDGRPVRVLQRPSDASHIAPVYGKAASALARRRVEVRCWSRRDWGEVSRIVAALDPSAYIDYHGFASPREARANLAPRVCSALAVLAYSSDRPASGRERRELAAAVLTLAHETEHVIAPASEARIECYALQDVRRVARALGASPAYAASLARVAWTEIYPANDPEYRTPSCRNGGSLDVRPRSDVWP